MSDNWDEVTRIERRKTDRLESEHLAAAYSLGIADAASRYKAMLAPLIDILLTIRNENVNAISPENNARLEEFLKEYGKPGKTSQNTQDSG